MQLGAPDAVQLDTKLELEVPETYRYVTDPIVSVSPSAAVVRAVIVPVPVLLPAVSWSTLAPFVIVTVFAAAATPVNVPFTLA